MGTKISSFGRLALALSLLSGAMVACNVEGSTNTRFGTVRGDARRNESGLHLSVQFKPPVTSGGNPRTYNTYVGVNTERGYPGLYGFFTVADENGL